MIYQNGSFRIETYDTGTPKPGAFQLSKISFGARSNTTKKHHDSYELNTAKTRTNTMFTNA